MFDALFPEAADAALTVKAERPIQAPEKPWFQGFWGAVAKAPLRAGAEMGRAQTSLMSPAAAGALDSPSMFGVPSAKPTETYQAEVREQGQAFAAAIKEVTPDAQTTGAASMIVHDVGRFVTKAVAYGAAGGPVGAVAGVGLDEGYNEAARRIDEGVDPATAAKLGLVKGVASAVAVALPVAGKTIGQTLGLAVAGGPGSFVAEQATAREILRSADYAALAEEIDPFDPVGLGVSFLGSFGFGAAALGMRRMKGKATVEQVDAAHVAVLQGHREAAALDSRPEAMEAHSSAMNKAAEQLAAGERVSVGDIAPADGMRMAETLQEPMKRLRAERLAAESVKPDPVAVVPFEPETGAVKPEANPDSPDPIMDSRMADIEAEFPDMPVMMEGMDAPMPMSRLLAEVKAMADQEIADAPLLRVAAECALRA